MEGHAAAPAAALQHDRGSLTLASGWPPASPQRRKGGRNPGTRPGRDSAAARSRPSSVAESPSSLARTSVKCRQNLRQIRQNQQTADGATRQSGDRGRTLGYKRSRAVRAVETRPRGPVVEVAMIRSLASVFLGAFCALFVVSGPGVGSAREGGTGTAAGYESPRRRGSGDLPSGAAGPLAGDHGARSGAVPGVAGRGAEALGALTAWRAPRGADGPTPRCAGGPAALRWATWTTISSARSRTFSRRC